jgi:hypothetical protein
MMAGTVIGVTGDMGAGKGVFATWLASQFVVRGFGAWANFDSTVCVRLESMADLVSCRRGVFFLDEVDVMMHARAFAAKHNIEFTQWLKLIRKYGLRCVWMTQNWSFPDVNLRRITSYMLYCSRPVSGLTKIDVYRIGVGDNEEVQFKHRASFGIRHTNALYRMFNTLDDRFCLSWEVGGRATAPLGFLSDGGSSDDGRRVIRKKKEVLS